MDVAVSVVFFVMFRKGQLSDRHMESFLHGRSPVFHDSLKSGSVWLSIGCVRIRYETKRSREPFQLFKLAARPCRAKSGYGVFITNGLHPKHIRCTFHHNEIIDIPLPACPVNPEQGFAFRVNGTGGRIDVFRCFLTTAYIPGGISDDASPFVSDRNHNALPEHGINATVFTALEHSKLKKDFFINPLCPAVLDECISVFRGITDSSDGTELFRPSAISVLTSFPAFVCHCHSQVFHKEALKMVKSDKE